MMVLSRMSSQTFLKTNPTKMPIIIDKMKQMNDKMKKLIIVFPFPVLGFTIEDPRILTDSIPSLQSICQEIGKN